MRLPSLNSGVCCQAVARKLVDMDLTVSELKTQRLEWLWLSGLIPFLGWHCARLKQSEHLLGYRSQNAVSE